LSFGQSIEIRKRVFGVSFIASAIGGGSLGEGLNQAASFDLISSGY
jgi:hypothetical protein